MHFFPRAECSNTMCLMIARAGASAWGVGGRGGGHLSGGAAAPVPPRRLRPGGNCDSGAAGEGFVLRFFVLTLPIIYILDLCLRIGGDRDSCAAGQRLSPHTVSPLRVHSMPSAAD